MKKASPKLIVALVCLIFLLFGLFNSGIGPILGELAALTNSSLAAVGGVLTFLFLGALVSMLVSGPLIDRFGQKIVMAVSLAFLIFGILGFSTAHSIPWMFFFFLLTGFGQGGMEVSGNLVVSDEFPTNSTGILNLLHFFFGVGACTGPALVSLAISSGLSGRIVQWIVVGAYVVVSIIFLSLYQNKRHEHAAAAPTSIDTKAILFRSPLLWIIGVMLLFYVGVEYGLGSWSTTFMGASVNMAVQQGALVTSAYWGFLTLGRLLGVVLSKKLSTLQLLGFAVSGALLGGIAFVIFHGSTTPMIIAVMAIGFCFGAVYPTTISLTTQAFSQNQGKAVGLVSAFGSIGGTILPWVAGVFLEKISPLAFSFFELGILVMLAVLYVLTRNFSKQHNQSLS
jgi:fucose permease